MKKNRLLFISLFFLFPYFLFSQTPFRCDGSMFVASFQNHRLYRITFDQEADTVKLSPLPQPIGFEVRAMGYSKRDNFIYGAAYVNNQYSLCRIDSTGKGFLIKQIPLDTTKFSGIFAADVTPDGQTLILFATPGSAVDNPNMSIIIDLVSPTFEHDEVIMSTSAGAPNVLVNDIIFHPLNELLYGHDFQGISNNQPNPYGKKTLIIDPFNGVIDNEVFFDNPEYLANSFYAMMVTPFGEIFGIDGIRQNYGGWSEMDAKTGISTRTDLAPFVNYNPNTFILEDGCSCPYTIAMEKTVDRDSTFGCTEVVFTYPISNLIENNQEQATFRDSFPPGFEVREVIHNPYPGTVSGLNTNVIEITNIELLYGLDSIQLKVWIPQGADGTHYTQAYLTNVDLSSTNQTVNAIRSDNPRTIARLDATPLTVVPLEVALSSEAYELCPDSSIIINPVPNPQNLHFLWSDGSSEPYLKIAEEGNYGVTVTGGCEKDSATFQVVMSPLSVELGTDMEGQFGDWIEISPTTDFLSPIESYFWQVSFSDSLLCDTCSEIAFELSGNTNIHLTINNEVGCQAHDELAINAIRQLYFPNAFSPNDDGINDWFYLQSKNPLVVKSFRVFDKWGGLVFEKENSETNLETEGWDGKGKNGFLQNGIFVWVAEVVFPDGVSITYKGETALVK